MVTFGLTAGMLSVAVAADDSGTSDAAAVAEQIGLADPSAVAPSSAVHTADGDHANPSLEATGGGFTSVATGVDSTIALSAESGFDVETDSGTLTVTPLDIASEAGDGGLVAGGDAVAFANTGTDADTVVRPTADGIETFTDIRGADAPETFSWEIDLPGDETLSKTSAGGVAITDPTPETTLADLPAKPAADAVSDADLSALKASGDAPQDAVAAPKEVPDNIGELATAQDSASTQPASEGVANAAPPVADGGAPPADVPEPARPADGDSVLPPAIDAEGGEAVSTSEASTAAAAADSADRANRDTAQHEEALRASEDVADLAAVNQPRVIAEVQPPIAVDAAGNEVPSELTVHGDTVTLTVSHREAQVSYPVSADPWITVVRTHDEWVCCRSTPHVASYVDYWYISGWNTVASYYGWAVWYLPHSYYGSGWYWVNPGWSGWVLMNPSLAWSPLLSPVYSPHWATYTYYTNDSYARTVTETEDVWINDRDDSVEDPTAFAADSPYNDAPRGWCRNGVVAAGVAYSRRHKFVVFEGGGDAKGPHVYRASVSSNGWNCEDRKTLVNWRLWYDASALVSAKLFIQYQAQRYYNNQIGVYTNSLGKSVIVLEPGTKSCGDCVDWNRLPSYEFGATPRASDNGRIRDIAVPISPFDDGQGGSIWTSYNSSPGLKARMHWKS